MEKTQEQIAISALRMYISHVESQVNDLQLRVRALEHASGESKPSAPAFPTLGSSLLGRRDPC